MGKTLRAIPPVWISVLLRFSFIFLQITLARTDFSRRKSMLEHEFLKAFALQAVGFRVFSLVPLSVIFLIQ